MSVLLRDESSLIIIYPHVASMLCFVYVAQEYTEERIGKKSRASGVREIGVYDEDGEHADEEVEAEIPEAAECIKRPDHTIIVWIKKFAVLLENCLVWVF